MARLFTDDEAKLVKEWVIDRTTKELQQKINATFNKDLTENQVLWYKKNHKLNSGLTGYYKKGNVPMNKGKKTPKHKQAPEHTLFKKGRTPHNIMEVGATATNGEGYLMQKIAQPNMWDFIHRLKYKEYHGEIPEGHMIIFANKDIHDFSKENLIAVTKGTNIYLNQYGLRYDDIELTKTGIATIDILTTAYKRKRELTNDK